MPRLAATRRVLMAAGLTGCLTAPAEAHHSYGMFYDLCTSVPIAGQVERVQWKNPHVLIEVRTDAGDAYIAEWTDVLKLTRDGVSADMLKPGDRIEVTGSPKRPLETIDPAYRYLVDPALKVVSALTQLRRIGDGWTWKRDPGPRPADCATR